MSDMEIFNEIVLTATYDDMGERFCSDKQQLLIKSLSRLEKVLYTAIYGGIISTDLYGPIQVQSIGNEDRLFFPKNAAHAHVKWSQVYEANLVRMPDHPKGKDCYWIGIDFLTKDGQSLFIIWNLQADQEFSGQVCENLGRLL